MPNGTREARRYTADDHHLRLLRQCLVTRDLRCDRDVAVFEGVLKDHGFIAVELLGARDETAAFRLVVFDERVEKRIGGLPSHFVGGPVGKNSASALRIRRHGEHVVSDCEVPVFDVGAAARHRDHAGLLRHQRSWCTRVEIACGQHHFHASFDEILGCARRLRGVRLGINVGQAQFLAENATRGIDIVNGDLGRPRRRGVESGHPAAERSRCTDQHFVVVGHSRRGGRASEDRGRA